MHGYIRRIAEPVLDQAMKRSPVVVVLGPRQCGKSTLAREYLKGVRSVYLDLQDRADRHKLNEPELFIERHRDELICLDEIQLLPGFFSFLRSEIDRDRRPGRFLILGSASRDLLRQTTETLAGRIAYLDLAPFILPEVSATTDFQTLWVRGGFPESLLATDELNSFAWRQDFIRTFLERDTPSLGLTIPMPIMSRLWQLLAHYHGQTVNLSKLAGAVDVSVPTLKKYLAILEQTYMIRQILPHEVSLKKRLIQSPKIYLRDSGLLHTLLDIDDYDQLLGNPIAGASWEGFAIENIMLSLPRHRASFLRTSNGAEVDLVMELQGRKTIFEFKLSKAPTPCRGFYELLDDIKPEKAFVVAPIDSMYEQKKDVWVGSLIAVIEEIRGMFP